MAEYDAEVGNFERPNEASEAGRFLTDDLFCNRLVNLIYTGNELVKPADQLAVLQCSMG